MKLYRVSNDWNKGIKEIDILNTDGETFEYFDEGWQRNMRMPLLPKYPNQPIFFLTYQEAKVYLIERIVKCNAEMQDKINKGVKVISSL